MLGYIALGFTVFTQILVIVWGASKLSAELNHLAKAVNKLSDAFEVHDSRIDAHDVHLENIDGRLANLEDRKVPRGRGPQRKD